ncbi:hypothetical protein EYF80_054439 [Liparis tanakae]|uniref:Uncharacterized protein n=1 Tax=Liparis tanakae TaxID=230148 RepID=A0A4Z2F3D4_9TELE|nr:hypothetical protein EYF80_054439 [Liparis tanakae]
MDCLFLKQNSLIFTIFSITTILLLLPLFILVLYLGFQRSSSSSAVMSHTDSFTYQLTSIELIGVLGRTICCCAVYLKQLPVLMWGFFLLTFTWYGQTFFHMLTCVERYLAVVHPVTYLGLRSERGVRIRTVSVGLSVLYILIRPGPGEQGGDRERVDQSKQRAFYTIMAILGPNVKPPGLKKQMEREEQPPEEPFIGWRQMLWWVAAMWRDQAEADRQLLEALRHQAVRQTYALKQLWLSPAPRVPSAAPGPRVPSAAPGPRVPSPAPGPRVPSAAPGPRVPSATPGRRLRVPESRRHPGRLQISLLLSPMAKYFTTQMLCIMCNKSLVNSK